MQKLVTKNGFILIIQSALTVLCLTFYSCTNSSSNADTKLSKTLAPDAYSIEKFNQRVSFIKRRAKELKLTTSSISTTPNDKSLLYSYHQSFSDTIGIYSINIDISYHEGSNKFYFTETRNYRLKKMHLVHIGTGDDEDPEKFKKMTLVHWEINEGYRFGQYPIIYMNNFERRSDEVANDFSSKKIDRFDDVSKWDSLYDAVHKGQ